MDRFGIAAALLLAAGLLLGCGTTRSGEGSTLFRFSFEGREFQIVGSSTHEGERANLLVATEAGRVAFRAIDRGQDGVIDDVVSGEVTVEEANRIYAAGITLSIREGRYRPRQVPHVYELIDVSRIYVVRSEVEGAEVVHNTFVMYDRATGAEASYVDSGADGALDPPEGGDADWRHAQRLYTRALEAGVRDGRIDPAGGRYRVR